MPTTNPVPSQDPSDLLFNAGKLDEVLNGTGNSFTDRLGVARRTVAGMNADFDAQLADAESDLNVYRADAAASAAQALGYLQTIRATSYGAYANDPATDPLGNPPTVGDEYFNTTANLLKRWNGTTWQASDINTANLAASSGSSLVGYGGQTVQGVLDVVTGPSGSASVGYTPGGVGAVPTTVDDALHRLPTNLKNFGSGFAAFIASVAEIGSAQKTLVVNESFTIASNFTVPQNITLKIDRGSVITINAGVTLTVLGGIDAGSYLIFSGPGTLDRNAGSAFFNLAWFEGEYLNDKWDFISRGLASLRPFAVVLPKPELGMQGAVEIAPNLVYWGIDAPIVFPDKANGCTWINGPESRIIATTAIDSMMEFSTDSKVEDVTFTSGVWLVGDSKASSGMKFHGGSRVRSNGLVQISDCGIPLYFDNTGGSNDKINFSSMYLARWSEAAIWVEGSGNAMVACYFPEVILEEPVSDLKSCIVVRGQTRGLRFGRIHYIHFADAKVADNIVLVQSTANGYSAGLKIDEIYTSSAATTLVKIENSGGSQRAVYTSLGKLVGVDATVPADLNYDTYTSVQEYTGPGIKYGPNCREPIPNTDIITRTFDFAMSGGAVGTYNLGGSLPKGCTVVRAWYKVVTGFASGGSATLRLGITGALAGIQAITPFNDAVWSVGIHDGIPNGTASAALPTVTDSITFPSFVVSNAQITAGKVIVYLQIVR